MKQWMHGNLEWKSTKRDFAKVANIIFGGVTENMLENWWRVLDECNPDSQYVFLTIDGDARCNNEKGYG